MLPPLRMSAKIFSIRGALLLCALALIVSGCTPAGPGALLKGKKYLERGDYDSAVTQFKKATTLLTTNAAAWNYYGVALQGAGHPIDAANAYQRALELDRDLIEARMNLGTLWMEQNKPETAKTEFTACTLRWPNDPTAWLKLGSAQLKLGETVPAERSFSAVLALKANEAEAYNGLGLARIQRGRPKEAAQFFAAAVKAKPDYAAALLNLATVNDQNLHDTKAALESYRAYLALEPRPDNWEEVNALVNNLELQSAGLAAAPAPAPAPSAPVTPPAPAPVAKPVAAPTVAAAEPKPKPQPRITTPPVVRLAQSPRAQSATPKPVAPAPATRPAPAPTVRPAPVQVVQVAPETQIVTRPGAAPATRTIAQTENTDSSYVASGVTPLPGSTGGAAGARLKPIKIIAPAPVNFPRYNYLSPDKPAAGDRRAASGAFTQARMAEQDEKWADTLRAYREAAELDPSWFEAQYNAAVVAQRVRNYASALGSYELALAIQPDSVDARYYFALTLKSAGYAPDAANELKKILAAHPKEVRAHLALANICAQSLRDPSQAREHYLKVLELDPTNPQTTEIQHWLAANPG
ncbi:MAG TPA: tetratricopeptide repeat protein [bacterium]|nr:tetratricopeptide repeat protein [bacterium]